MVKIDKKSVKLSGVHETMLIPLYARAIETQKDISAFCDSKAVQIMNSIDYDFEKFKKCKMTHWGVAARTIILDKEVKKYIKKYPKCSCISIGCGLDTRFYRVDNQQIKWYDMDFKPVIKLRRQLISQHDRVKVIEGSALDKEWTQNIDKDKNPVLIILEGILMYFTEEEAKKLFNLIVNAFPNCTILAELMPPAVIKHQNKHDSISKTTAVFKWGIQSSKDIEKLCTDLKFVEEWNLTSEMKRFSPIFISLISPILKKNNNRIAKFVTKKI